MASSHRRILKDLGLLFKARHSYLKNSLSRHISATARCQQNVLYGAVCVQRLPIITPVLNDIERRYSDLMSKLELEKSFYCDFEIRLKNEVQAAKKLQESNDGNDEKTEGEAETALDLIDKWDSENKNFAPAPRETEADQTNDQRSLDRKLDSSLYLLVKQDIEGKDHWVLPQTLWQQGETLRQTAERALTMLCGDVKTTFLGNAPCAVAKFDPKETSDDRKVKLFFFQAWYREGDIQLTKTGAKDYLWVTRKELNKYCHQSYRKHLHKFIFDL